MRRAARCRSAAKERSAKKAGKNEKRLQHQQGLGDATPGHRAAQAPAARTGKDRYRLSKQQKAKQGLDMLLDVSVASMSRAQGVQVAQDIRAGRVPRMSKNQMRVLRKQLQELGVNLTKADIARHRVRATAEWQLNMCLCMSACNVLGCCWQNPSVTGTRYKS